MLHRHPSSVIVQRAAAIFTEEGKKEGKLIAFLLPFFCKKSTRAEQ
jgi:hypothetical protein